MLGGSYEPGIAFMPEDVGRLTPFVITEDQLDEAASVLRKAVLDVWSRDR
jgi:hypothetical protein